MAELNYRVMFRNVKNDGELLYDADNIPIPRVGDLVTFPSGRTWLITTHQRQEYRIDLGKTPPHSIDVFVEPFTNQETESR